MDPSQASLEPGPEAMRELLSAVAERLIAYCSSLEAQPACDVEGGLEVARLVIEPLPETGQSQEQLLELLFERLLPKVCNTNSPGMFSYVNCGAGVHAAVADLITAVTNPYVGYWAAAPGLAQLEHTVIRWFADLLGLPESAGGVLLSGGSLGNLSALVTARKALLGQSFGSGTIYTSDQVHHSVPKAVMLAGFPDDALRLVPTDDSFRMRLDALDALVQEDKRAGRIPFCIVASAGTTNTGAVDDLMGLADFARAHGLWFHVDAAYGGCFALTERGKAALSGIERADTVVLDPHKSLFTPFGTGCLLARDVSLLRRAHELHSNYIGSLVDASEHAGALNFADLSPEQTRGMRGLRIWLPLKLLGARAFRAALDEKLDLARSAAAELMAMPGFELVAQPQLSIFAFRAHEPGLSPAELDSLNRELLERVNLRARVHLSATSVRGRFTLRMCVLSLRSHERAVRVCLDELRECRDIQRT